MILDDPAGHEPIDVRARRADPADPQSAPRQLAERADRDDPVAGSNAAIGRGVPLPRTRVGGEVLDDLEAVLGRRPGQLTTALLGIVAPVGLWYVGTT